jgi:hypothetical protein
MGGTRIKPKRDLLEKHISESLLSTSFQRHPADWMRWIKLLFPDVARGHQERHVWHRPSNEEGVSNPNQTKESLNVLSTKAVRRYTSVSGQDRTWIHWRINCVSPWHPPPFSEHVNNSAGSCYQIMAHLMDAIRHDWKERESKDRL